MLLLCVVVKCQNLPLCKPCWRNSGAWRPNVALYHDLSWIDQGALEIALVHGSAPPRYRAARVVLATGEAFGPLNPTTGCCPISMA